MICCELVAAGPGIIFHLDKTRICPLLESSVHLHLALSCKFIPVANPSSSSVNTGPPIVHKHTTNTHGGRNTNESWSPCSS